MSTKLRQNILSKQNNRVTEFLSRGDISKLNNKLK